MIDLILDDCMNVMKKYDDNHFDLAIVDPPYGLGIDGQKLSINNKNPKHNRKEHTKKNWDNNIPNKEYFDELFRVSKNQIIWGGNYMVEHLKASKGWIVWYKGQEGLTMSDCELAYSSFEKPTRVVKINRVELLKDGTIHPTQKPKKLYEWILHNYSEKGQKILDTHLGSGSIAIACHYFGVDLVGIEIDKEYYDKAKHRVDELTKQTTMF